MPRHSWENLHKMLWFRKRTDGSLDVQCAAIPISSRKQLPLDGEPGECFYLENEHKVVRWDEKNQDWEILVLDQIEDQYNDRRGAIKAQKARKQGNKSE